MTTRFRILGFNAFEAALIAVVTVISLFFFVQALRDASGAAPDAILFAALDLVAAFAGICSVVLCAKGKRSGFIFGLVNVTCYALISFHNAYYGEVMLNTLFYIPSNIVSFILWTRHKDHEREDKEVKARAMKKWQLAASFAVAAVATFGYHFVLRALGGAMTGLDGATTILSIFATVLMALRYSEQWLFWIIVNVLTVALWCVAGDPVMIAMWGAYLANAIYGYLMWLNKAGWNVPFGKLLDAAAR